jgi:hypothetical protein
MSAIVKKETSALAEYKMQMTTEDLGAIIVANVGDRGLTVTNLDRALNPSSKATEWEIPTLEGDPEKTDTIKGVIVFHKLSRARWPGAYKGGGDPPVCSSKNGIFAEGDPGGQCNKCPYAKFTKNADGEDVKPECRVVKQLFIKRPDELLPLLVNITSVNLPLVDSYLYKLLNKQRLFSSVVTTIHNTSAVSSGGFPYAKTNFSTHEADFLPEELAAEMKEYTEFIKPMLLEIELTDADASDGESEPF